MTLEVITFGCRLNAYESEAIKLRAGEAQLKNTVVVNTCAVTAEAVRQSRQLIRKLKREDCSRRIIVTGCAAQIEPRTYAAMTEVDQVIGNAEKLTKAAYADFGVGSAERVRVNDIMSVRETASQLIDHFDSRSRAFVQVQNGCDHRCTFCVIPFGRGNSRSVPMGGVIEEIRRLVENGFCEVVLSGVDLTSYGCDLPGRPGLGQLVQKILKHIPELRRLRLSSLDSIEVDDTLMRAISEEERLMPHFHLSVQSGDDMILKRMRRRHRRSDTIGFCEKLRLRRPDAAIGADLIAGFPTETEDMFTNSVRLVSDAGLDFLHVFPYSPRTGTPAAKMPQHPRTLIKARAKRLREEGQKAMSRRLETLVGSLQSVLIEKTGFGRTPCFAPVVFSGEAKTGSIVKLAITARCNDQLLGRAL